PRVVPVLARYHQPLLASAGFAGDGLVTGGSDPGRHNVSNPLTRSLAGGSGLPPPGTSRLRATWLAECAQLTGLATFLHAAGITCSQRLGDIICRSGGVIVAVGGRRPRAVPVLARYHQPLLASAAFAGDGLVTGGTDPARRNVTTPLTRALAGGTGLPRLDTSRLRATWLADCAAQIGLATFMHAAGITCSQRLGDLLATLAPGTEAEAVALLGAGAR
ncbi:MAG: hypothetical protein ACHP9Z_35090, partial [Streptosporangiales bacterium]